MTTTIEKTYASTRYGQLHVRQLPPAGDETGAPLLCLHPAPSSGLYFTTAMPLLNDGRRVLAPDYPGYGGSAAPDDDPAIADYATAMLDCLDSLGVDDPVDVLGFHTGCLVGTEMAILRADRCRRLVLCDVPYFDAAQRATLLEQMAQPMGISADIACIEKAWRFNVDSRIEHVPLPRAFELFAEHLRAGDNDYRGFAAAFSYDCESRFAALDADVVLLATQSALHAPTVAVSEVIRGARFVDVPEVTTAVFETGAAAIAGRVNESLA